MAATGTNRTTTRKNTRSRSTGRTAPRWKPVDRPLVVCTGGPLDGRWYFADEFTIQQTAAVRMRVSADRPEGVALAYHPCTPYRATGNPQFDVVGQVLLYDPTYDAAPGDHQPIP